MCRKVLRHGAYGFTSPLKEVVLLGSIAHKNPSSSTGSKIGSSEKRDNQFTSEDDRELFKYKGESVLFERFHEVKFP
jgi:hypothetical protein